jgi:hypothetical protein
MTLRRIEDPPFTRGVVRTGCVGPRSLDPKGDRRKPVEAGFDAHARVTGDREAAGESLKVGRAGERSRPLL